MADSPDQPRGTLALRTLAMPKDTNPAGDIFGGWLMSQMDIAAGITAGEYAQGRVATVAVEGMVFHKPVYVGDVVCCYTDVTGVGTTSITMMLEVYVLRAGLPGQRIKVTQAQFTFVALDAQGRKRPVQALPLKA